MSLGFIMQIQDTEEQADSLKSHIQRHMGLDSRKRLLGLGTTKAQTSLHICSLISAFFYSLMESIIYRLAASLCN